MSVDDPARMNILGLFLAAALERNLSRRRRPCALRGTLTVDADGMKASVVFGAKEVLVTRETAGSKVVLSGPLHRFTAALARTSLRAMLGIRVRGDRLFALRALGVLRP